MGSIVSTLLWLFITFFIFVRSAEIENARAIVTGAANGIGYACAHDLLHRGAQAVAILDFDLVNGTKATQKLINEFGENRVFFFSTDVSDSFQFEEDFLTAVQFLGGLDIMINNAGLLDETVWDQEIETNIKGVIQGTLMSFDVMGKHKGGKGGTVINMGSIASLTPIKYFPVYEATKYAVLGFSRSIALSYNVTGVAVKTMCPGDTDTPMVTSKAHRFLDFIDYNETMMVFGSVHLQEPEDVSKEVIRLIEEAPNGAVWMVEKDQPTIMLDFPNYREWGTPV